MKKLLPRPVLFAPLLLSLVAALGWLSLPWPILLRWSDPGATAVMRHRVERAEDGGEALEVRHRPVPLDAVSPHLVRAVVLAEDARFWEHGGIDWHALADEVEYDGAVPPRPTEWEDWSALARALRYAWAHRSEVRGRSTITQQLAKNLYYTPERSIARKFGEFFVARRLEWFLSKERILELYLNAVELGPGLFGVEAASRAYFGVSAAALTPYQAASLAATLPHPLTSNPAHRPGRMAWRRDLILRRLRGASAEEVPLPDTPPEIELDVPGPEGGESAPGDTGVAKAAVPDTAVEGTGLAPLQPPDTAGSGEQEER